MTQAVEAPVAPPIEALAQGLGAAVLGAASAVTGLDVKQQAALASDLDPARVRKKPGSNLDYLATHDCIRTANRIFGFGRWGHEVVDLALVGSAQVKNSKGEEGWYTGYRCTVRLTVSGCVPVCGVGYGDAFEKQWSAPITTHELAVKEAESDALKRALAKFGDQFGLILYAKDDEARRIAAEKAQAEYDAAADTFDVDEACNIADALGKGDAVRAALDREEREHGHVRSGWLARQLDRLRELAANGEPVPATETSPVAESNTGGGRTTPAADSSGSAAAGAPAAPEGDRWATDDETSALIELAEKAPGVNPATVKGALTKHRDKNGGQVSAAWLGRQVQALLAKASQVQAPAERSPFQPPDSVMEALRSGQDHDPAAVQAAFTNQGEAG